MHEIDEEGLSNRTDEDRLAGLGQRRRRGVMVTGAAVVALGLSLGGVAVAGASTTPASSSAGPAGSAPPAPHGGRPPMGGSPPAAMGTVASVGDGTFTLTTTGTKTVTVNVGPSTTYRDPGVTSPTLANVKVGEHVAVFGTDASDVVTATSVAIGLPPSGSGGHWGPGGPGGSPPAAMGTVASVGDGTFTLTTRATTGTTATTATTATKTVTVNVGPSTTYRDPGVTSPTLANVKVGEHVAVFGTDASDVITATSVAIGTPPTGAGGPGGPGSRRGVGSTAPTGTPPTGAPPAGSTSA